MPGARFARTTAPTAPPGIIFRTITRAREAYRWNEDGIAGICDRHQKICFAIALWNGHDPILKERLFGLTGNEGNHGEDVKECYYYLDNTPTHSYMKYLYKYPQAAFPYEQLVDENRRRGKNAARIRTDRHRRLRRGPLLRRVRRVCEGRRRYSDPYHRRQPRPGSRGPASAADTLVPQYLVVGQRRSEARNCSSAIGNPSIELNSPSTASRWLHCEGSPELLFTENETNSRRLYGPTTRRAT